MATTSLTSFTPETDDRLKILDALMVSGFLLALCWIPFLMEEFLGFHLKQYGVFPRTIEGLAGLVTVNFLHSTWEHIGQNSLGILVMNTALFYFYRSISFRIFWLLLFIPPVLLWFTGRPNNHIGASILLYAEFAFLFFSGIIRRDPLLMRVSLVIVLYYGSLVWYLFPIDAKVSWEGHACGFVVGLAAAYFLRRQGPQRKVYRFETEPELPDDENAYWKTPEQRAAEAAERERLNPTEPPQETTIRVRYHYKENDQPKDV